MAEKMMVVGTVVLLALIASTGIGMIVAPFFGTPVLVSLFGVMVLAFTVMCAGMIMESYQSIKKIDRRRRHD